MMASASSGMPDSFRLCEESRRPGVSSAMGMAAFGSIPPVDERRELPVRRRRTGCLCIFDVLRMNLSLEYAVFVEIVVSMCHYMSKLLSNGGGGVRMNWFARNR